MKKMCEKKRNNKGFSLVELIVVILIMAVIAVALAPQVMKWVGRSKENTDKNNIGQIESAVNAGVADYMDKNNTATVPVVTYKVEKNGITTTSTGAEVTKLTACIEEVMNGKHPTVQSKSDEYFFINISSTGSVTVVQSATAPTPIPVTPGT